MHKVDLTIVGGGFAGLTCAESAAARGVNTVILERKKNPCTNIHTTGILVKEVADLWDFPQSLTRKIKGVRLYSPALDSIDLYSPGYYFLATDTPQLMQWLSDRAVAAGAHISFKSCFHHMQKTEQGIVIPAHNIDTRYLVAADGARSRVAAQAGLDQNQRFLYGIEAEFKNIKGVDPDHMHVFLDSEIAPGYIAWLVPGVKKDADDSECQYFQLGLASNKARCLDLDALIQRLKYLFDFSHATLESRRGGLIPCGGPLKNTATNHMMLLGDAAGMVSPVTAGGIHPAMQLGRLTGIAVADHLLDQGPAPDKVVRNACSSWRFKKVLRQAYDRYPLSNQRLNRLFKSRMFRSFAQTVFFHHRGLFSIRAWSDIFRGIFSHSPKQALKP